MQVEKSESEAHAVASSRRGLVLVIDPNETTRSVLEVALARDGFDVWSSATAERARELMRRGRLPDMVVVESELAGEDGFSFVASLRGDAVTERVPVLLLATARERNVSALADVVGIDQYLQKPAYARDVVSLVRLEQQRRHGALEFQASKLAPGLLLRALLSGPRSGKLTLADGRAVVSFRDGAVIEVRFGAHRDVEGLTRALALTRGTYEVALEPVDGAGGLRVSAGELIAQVLPRLTRFEQVIARSLPLDSRLQLDFARLAEVLPTMPEGINGVVQLFDGFRRLDDVVVDSPFNETLTVEVATRLYLLRVVQPPAGEREPVLAGRVAPTFFEPKAESARLLDTLFEGQEAPAVEPAPAPDPDWFEEPKGTGLDVAEPSGGWIAAPVDAVLAGLPEALKQQLSAFNIPVAVEPPPTEPQTEALRPFVRGEPEAQTPTLVQAVEGVAASVPTPPSGRAPVSPVDGPAVTPPSRPTALEAALGVDAALRKTLLPSSPPEVPALTTGVQKALPPVEVRPGTAERGLGAALATAATLQRTLPPTSLPSQTNEQERGSPAIRSTLMSWEVTPPAMRVQTPGSGAPVRSSPTPAPERGPAALDPAKASLRAPTERGLPAVVDAARSSPTPIPSAERDAPNAALRSSSTPVPSAGAAPVRASPTPIPGAEAASAAQRPSAGAGASVPPRSSPTPIPSALDAATQRSSPGTSAGAERVPQSSPTPVPSAVTERGLPPVGAFDAADVRLRSSPTPVPSAVTERGLPPVGAFDAADVRLRSSPTPVPSAVTERGLPPVGAFDAANVPLRSTPTPSERAAVRSDSSSLAGLRGEAASAALPGTLSPVPAAETFSGAVTEPGLPASDLTQSDSVPGSDGHEILAAQHAVESLAQLAGARPRAPFEAQPKAAVLGKLKVGPPAPSETTLESAFFGEAAASGEASSSEPLALEGAEDAPTTPKAKRPLGVWVAVGAAVLVIGALVEAGLSRKKPEPPPEPAPVVEAPMPTAAPVALTPPAEEPPPEAAVDVSENLIEARKFYETGQYPKALSVLEQVVTDAPTSADGWLLLALVRYDSGSAAGAKQAVDKVLALDPNNARVQILIAAMAFDAGDKDRAKAALNRYLELDPHGPHADEAQALLKR